MDRYRASFNFSPQRQRVHRAEKIKNKKRAGNTPLSKLAHSHFRCNFFSHLAFSVFSVPLW